MDDSNSDWILRSSMNDTEYKKLHESYMRNNQGSTAIHTFFCILFTVQCASYVAIKSRFSVYSQYAYEYLVIVLTMILAHTVLADYIYELNAIVFIFLQSNLLFFYGNVKHFERKNVFKDNKLALISCLRGLTYLITVFCILAVDFKSFPRNLAKTERYGYSLMDTGVGLFVIMSGVVHKDPREQSLKSIMKGNLKMVAVLFILGVGRFVSVKQLDYQEHVTEYGVHWNFFFTMAVCKILSTLVLYLSDHTLMLCIVTMLLHEFTLYMGLQDWVFGDSPRDSLISANREGIASSLGYVSIYLYGVFMKKLLLDKNVSKLKVQLKLFFGTVLMWSVTNYINVFRPASRTLANAGYCVYIDTLLITMSFILYFITVIIEDKYFSYRVPVILAHINNNGLVYFLLANLLTGAINLSTKTLLTSPTTTFLILNAYMVMTLGLIIFLEKLGLRI